MNILILQLYDANIAKYFKYCSAINSAYCLEHNYNYLAENIKYREGYTPHWEKIFSLIKYAKQQIYDYIFFLDADAIFLNYNVSLESKISETNTGIVFSENGSLGGDDIINSGAIIMRCGIEEINFFQEVINLANEKQFEQYKTKQFHEQTLISHLYITNKYNDLIKVRELDFINSYFKHDYLNDFEKSNQYVFHFCSRDFDRKYLAARDVFFHKLYEVYYFDGKIPQPYAPSILNKKVLAKVKWQARQKSQQNFIAVNQQQWIEHSDNGSTYYWDFSCENDKYIELVDKQRNFTVRLFDNQCHINTNEQRGFYYLFSGSWI